MSDNVTYNGALTPEQIVNVLTPVVEAEIGRRLEEVYSVIEDLRQQMIATVGVLEGNDQAIIAEIQRLRGSGGELVAEVLSRAGESWQRFVMAEAQHLGLKLIVPKGDNE